MDIKYERGKHYCSVRMPEKLVEEFPDEMRITFGDGSTPKEFHYMVERRLFLPATEERQAIIGAVLFVRYHTPRNIAENIGELFR